MLINASDDDGTMLAFALLMLLVLLGPLAMVFGADSRGDTHRR